MVVRYPSTSISIYSTINDPAAAFYAGQIELSNHKDTAWLMVGRKEVPGEKLSH
jgi:hypothetical protein